MMILTVFLVPFAFVYYISGQSESGRHLNLITFFLGLAGGVCALFIDSLSGLSGFMSVTGFFSRVLLSFASDCILPFVVGILPVFLLSVSPFREKLSLLRAQLFGLFSVFLPYRMLALYNVPDIWAVTVIPSMTISILFLVDFFIGRLLGKVSGSPDALDILFSSLPVLVAIIISIICITLWSLCFPFWTYSIASFAVIGAALFLRIVKYYR
jgi:hypothetical protein